MTESKKTMMHWYSTSDRLPEHGQKVLIYCHGEYNLAMYNGTNGGFILKGGAFFHPDDWSINWTKLNSRLFTDGR